MTTQTAALSCHSIPAPARSPLATASSTGTMSDFIRISSGWHSGSPKRALNSSVFTIGDDEKRGLFTGQKLLDDDPRTGAAEGVAAQHVTHGRNRFPARPGDYDTFPGRPAIGLDHNRRPGAVDEGFGLGLIGEHAVGGGRHVVLLHQIF